MSLQKMCYNLHKDSANIYITFSYFFFPIQLSVNAFKCANVLACACITSHSVQEIT